ncbi:MAG: response regulator [Candidatus Omnitrophica bacterium]|nr:response regulator [Candidatus Omnitrophota bacterium]
MDMKCPNYAICEQWHKLNKHPGGAKFEVLKKLGTCSSLEYSQCMYVFKIHSPKIPLLIVEDEDGIRNNLMHIIESVYPEALAIYPANSYFQAYQIIQKKYFPIAFLDIRLTDGSGIQLLDDMNRESRPTTPIMITAYDKYTELIEHAEEKGVVEFISKPFKSKEIEDILNNYLPPIFESYHPEL